MTDNVNHPSHYAEGWSNGAEVIDITENLNFSLGNAVKYIARAGKKDPDKTLEDLQKAKWYLEREINRWDNPPAYQVVPGPVSQEFWDDIDASILQAQEKRERDTTSRPPRVWGSLGDVPKGLLVTSADGYSWWEGEGPNGTTEKDAYGPFTEILDIERVKQIRSLYGTGKHSHRSLAAMFGVTHQAIRDLLIRKNYRWVA